MYNISLLYKSRKWKVLYTPILVVCVPVPSGTVGFFVVLSTFKKSLPCVSSLFLIKNTYSSNITTFNTAYIAHRSHRGPTIPWT